MSKVESTACDLCRKRVDDVYEAKGWIQFNLRSVAISLGRAANRAARTRYWSKGGADTTLDFCGLKCFLAWVEKIPSSDGKS